MDFLNSVLDFFNEILEFKNTGIYQFFTHWFSEFVIWFTISSIKTKLFFISFAWDVAKEILITLNISSLLQQAWSNLDSNVLNLITFFKLPEALNIVMSAKLTRYVMGFIGL